MRGPIGVIDRGQVTNHTSGKPSFLLQLAYRRTGRFFAFFDPSTWKHRVVASIFMATHYEDIALIKTDAYRAVLGTHRL